MSVVLNDTRSTRSVPGARYDAVVVGAGPYGLSAAAHLVGRGLTVGVFGKTLELWRNSMPKGMLLRSHWWATNLSDPQKQYGFGRFLSTSHYEKGYPMPVEAFIDYAFWFKERAALDVDETYVSSVERQGDHFLLTLEDGRSVQSAVVVMATGLHRYVHRPERFTRLPPDLVSHSCEHNDLSRFRGTRVVIIGGGQSAIEYAALLHEVGATVHVVSRRPISWLAPDRLDERTILEQILAPNTGLAPGWKNWMLVQLPGVFYRLPQNRKDRHNSNYMAAAADWLRNRVIGKVTLHESQTVVTMEADNEHVDVTISDGERVNADHVLLATGYRVDISKMTMLHPSLLVETRTEMGVPMLSRDFESSVPGLYFVGLTSARAFGPAYRFVVGCHAAARHVANSAVQRRTKRSRSVAIAH